MTPQAPTTSGPLTPEGLRDLLAKATARPWNGRLNAGFGVQIPALIQFRGNHGDYMSEENARAVISVLNRADLLVQLWDEAISIAHGYDESCGKFPKLAEILAKLEALK